MSDRIVNDEGRGAILDALLERAAFDGWTERTLQAAAADAGYDAALARAAFPGGLQDALARLYEQWDEAMIASLDEDEIQSLRIRERIALAVRTRLSQHVRHREALRRLVAVQMMPSHAPAASRALYRTVDAMWRAAGDTATDYNFYTKRGLLAGVYSSTFLFWLNDKSPEFSASWAFLDRRIENVMGIQKLRGKLDKLKPGGGTVKTALCGLLNRIGKPSRRPKPGVV